MKELGIKQLQSIRSRDLKEGFLIKSGERRVGFFVPIKDYAVTNMKLDAILGAVEKIDSLVGQCYKDGVVPTEGNLRRLEESEVEVSQELTKCWNRDCANRTPAVFRKFIVDYDVKEAVICDKCYKKAEKPL